MLGYDVWIIQCEDLFEFLQAIDQLNIRIYHLKKIDSEMYQFVSKSFHRHFIKKLPFPLYYQKSMGKGAYLFRFFFNPSKILFVGVFLLSIYLSTFFIWHVEVLGNYESINENLYAYFQDQYIQKGSLKLSLENLQDIENQIKINFEDDIDYLNLYQNGSVLYLNYTKKIQDDKIELDYRNIYACKPGMIAYFEVNSGHIKVKVNDYVQQGDLLIENNIVSTSDEMKIIPTLGKVFAYTWVDIEASMPSFDQGDVFNELLLKIRESLPADCIIDKENVVQFIETEGVVTLKVHYTLIENIACKGE